MKPIKPPLRDITEIHYGGVTLSCGHFVDRRSGDTLDMRRHCAMCLPIEKRLVYSRARAKRLTRSRRKGFI